MSNNKKTEVAKLVSILFGLALGQLIIFLLINPEGWQPIDKALFGLAIGVGLAGLFRYILVLSTKKKNN